MVEDIDKFVSECNLCAINKRPHHAIRAPLQPIPVGAEPWETVGMDIVGPLPRTANGNQHILVVCDYLSKFPVAIALKNQTASTVAKAFVNNVVCQYGCPKHIITDRGTNFTSKVMQELFEYLGIKQKLTTSYHPMCNGLTERFNGTLIQMIRTCSENSQNKWDSVLPRVLLAYRSAPHSSTKVSPYKMLYGRGATAIRSNSSAPKP